MGYNSNRIFSKTNSLIPNINMKAAQRAVARRFGGVVAGELDFTQLNTELALRQFGCEAVKSKRAEVALKRLAFWSTFLAKKKVEITTRTSFS